MKLTPMDVQQRRRIKNQYIPSSIYVCLWRSYVFRTYRVSFGRAKWSIGVKTKRWYNQKSKIIIYNIHRGKRRFRST